MKKFQVCTLSLLLGSTFALTQVSRAASNEPPLFIQVKQVTRWFVGKFDNAEQVANQPNVPLITMSNCMVRLEGKNISRHSRAVYLEQKTNGVPFRVRFYSFSKGDKGVKLSIRRFVDEDQVLGICDSPKSQRVVSMDNIVTQSCEVEVTREAQSYSGNNEPDGCPTTIFPGGKVVSEVTIKRRGTDSLDKFFDAEGNEKSGTEIEFRRIPFKKRISS
ncbi:MAG: chromophore lyase CpcT/CpeT [Calothrix sp. MO_167.B12]|nr:chromophore lyase CpcT/CpeT [Calothrix sp. MO_167.B12]